MNTCAYPASSAHLCRNTAVYLRGNSAVGRTVPGTSYLQRALITFDAGMLWSTSQSRQRWVVSAFCWCGFPEQKETEKKYFRRVNILPSEHDQQVILNPPACFFLNAGSQPASQPAVQIEWFDTMYFEVAGMVLATGRSFIPTVGTSFVCACLRALARPRLSVPARVVPPPPPLVSRETFQV